METVIPELGFYALAGQPKSPRDLIAEVQAGEAMGLGTVFLSERYNSKEIGAISGAAAAASRPTGRANAGAGPCDQSYFVFEVHDIFEVHDDAPTSASIPAR